MSRGPLKVPVSAQKALQRPETETRELLEGTEEKKVIALPSRQINDFTKKENKKIGLVARPGPAQVEQEGQDCDGLCQGQWEPQQSRD